MMRMITSFVWSHSRIKRILMLTVVTCAASACVMLFRYTDRITRNKRHSTSFEVEQEERKERIASYCRSHPDLNPETDYSSPEGFNSILVNDERRILFCFVPKVACTVWKKIFYVLSGVFKAKQIDDIKMNVHIINSPFVHDLGRYSMDAIKYRLNTYTKYIFVRHPFDRLLSAYRSKFTRKNKHFQRGLGVRIIKKYRPNPSIKSLTRGHDVTFDEFVKFMMNYNMTHMDKDHIDPHWIPFYRNCMPCQIQYDFVGKFETLEEDSLEALKMMGASDVIFPKITGNHTRTSDLLQKQFATVPTKRIRTLYRHYSADFKMFGYEFPKFDFFGDFT